MSKSGSHVHLPDEENDSMDDSHIGFPIFSIPS